jgi:L-malate glycosyltransferase
MHLLPGLEIGGAERAVLRLAQRAIEEGMDHRLFLFDKPFRSERWDFNPGNVTADYLPRRPGIDVQFARRLAHRMRKLQINLVHAHNDTAIFYAALAKSIGRLRQTSLVGTFRNRPTHATLGARISTRWATRRADHIVAVSQELSQWLVLTGWVKQCETIWNGVSLSDFSPIGAIQPIRSQFGMSRDSVVVGHIGRFVPIKRHKDLIYAASMLSNTWPPLYFIFAGSGPLLENVRERAASLRNVILLNNVSDVGALLRSLDIFVLCSEHEGTPQALLEAMACARPIIATAVGGIPNVLGAQTPEPAGRLVRPGTPGQLADEIIRLARDNMARRRLGQLALRRAHFFSFEQEWTEYYALYQKQYQRGRLAV